jgi:hypothetical protein
MYDPRIPMRPKTRPRKKLLRLSPGVRSTGGIGDDNNNERRFTHLVVAPEADVLTRFERIRRRRSDKHLENQWAEGAGVKGARGSRLDKRSCYQL